MGEEVGVSLPCSAFGTVSNEGGLLIYSALAMGEASRPQRHAIWPPMTAMRVACGLFTARQRFDSYRVSLMTLVIRADL